MAGPLSPPASIPSRESSRSIAFGFFWAPWHSRQCVAKSGRTDFSKKSAAAAVGGSDATAARDSSRQQASGSAAADQRQSMDSSSASRRADDEAAGGRPDQINQFSPDVKG